MGTSLCLRIVMGADGYPHGVFGFTVAIGT